MLDKERNSPSTPERFGVSFQKRLQGITSRQLSVESVETYAQDALKDILALIDDAVTAYIDTRPSPDSVREFEHTALLEDAAFEYFGLQSLEDVLDRIGYIQSEIDASGQMLEESRDAQCVIGRTDDSEIRFYGPSNVLANMRQEVIPCDGRSKATVFVFRQWITESGSGALDAVRVSESERDNKMVRKKPYFALVSEADQRVVLTCDAPRSACFVFDTKKLEAAGVSVEAVIAGSKAEWEALAKGSDNVPSAGRRLSHTAHFLDRLAETLDNPVTVADESNKSRPHHYLRPAEGGPVEWVSTKRMLDAWEGATGVRLTYDMVTTARIKLKDTLGVVQQGSFNNAPGFAWTPAQMDTLFNYFSGQGIFEQRAAGAMGEHGARPDGVLVRSEICEKFGIANSTDERGYFMRALAAARENNPDFGEPTPVHAARYGVDGYTERQQEFIREQLEKIGAFSPVAEQGEESLASICLANGFKKDSGRVSIALERLGWKLPKKRCGNYVTEVLTLEQVPEFVNMVNSISLAEARALARAARQLTSEL